MADYINSPLSSDNMTTAGVVNTKPPKNIRMLFIGAVIAVALSTISIALGIYLYFYNGLHKNLKNTAVSLVWLIISCALVYILVHMTYFCYRNLPVKTKKGDVEGGTPLQMLRRKKKPQGTYLNSSAVTTLISLQLSRNVPSSARPSSALPSSALQ